MRRLLPLAAAALACAPAPEVGAPIALPPLESFAGIEARILVPRCATSGCHTGFPPPTAPLSLDAGRGYGELVGRPALSAPGLALVEPGDPARSALALRLRGATGARMPLGQGALEASDLAAVEGWIAAGAKP